MRIGTQNNDSRDVEVVDGTGVKVELKGRNDGI